MSWVTIIWSMVASACLTLAAIHLLVWRARRSAWANLLFALTAVSTAVFAGCEFGMMRAETPGQFGTALRWLHVPTLVIVLSVVGFVRLHLRAGRPWLAWTACTLRVFSLLLNFLVGQNLNYLEVTRLRHIPFLGESVAIAEGVSNPWMLVGQLSLLFLVVFVADATITVWRRGDRRLALVIGGSLTFSMLLGPLQGVLVLWQIVEWPVTTSWFFMPVVAAMAHEMSRDTLRAAKLSDDLRESEARMTLAADAANLGMWFGDILNQRLWTSDQCKRLFGYAPHTELTPEDLHARVHPEDRALRERAIEQALAGAGKYDPQFRVVLPDGTVRWLASAGRVERDAAGNPTRFLGVAIDITERRNAEAAARDLGGRLINAQEKERSRIARELHDDLSQKLALLSVELEMFGQRPSAQTGSIAGQMQEFSGELKRLATDVHRLAYDLHPAKLDQLGLAAAVRGFCKDLAVAHEIAIACELRDVPRELPDDLALCLYRITQEALQNAIKHSGATGAKVELAAQAGELRLLVMDDGHGFDPQAVEARASLGIVSMRERVRMVRGQISVQSHAGEGTRIEVRVPIPPQAADA